jgi:hypothetical protein
VLLAALVPPLTAALTVTITRRRNAAWLAGFLAGFTGFYLPYQTTTDSFVVYMVLGGLFFLTFLRLKRARGFLMGLLAGLMHLARADGLLWLGIAGLAGLFDLAEEGERIRWKAFFSRMFTMRYLRFGAAVVAGYLLVMAPWFWRNIQVFGGLFPPGGSRAIWALDYDELFAYPASQLTAARWWGAGIGPHLAAWGKALWANLQTTFISMGVLLPGLLAVLGFWRNRQRNMVRLGLVGLAVLFGVLSLIFPFSGVNGSYFHSGAAFVPLILSMAPDGIDVLTKASLRRFKTWEDRRIRPFYTVVVIVFVGFFSLYTYFSVVVGFDGELGMNWNMVQERYETVDAVLNAFGAEPGDLVLATNPPGLTAVTGHPAVGTPDGEPETLAQVAADFGVRWVLVEPNHPEGLEAFYDHPEDVGGLTFIETVEDVHIFRWEGVQP